MSTAPASQASSCDGKVAFTSAKVAHKVSKRRTAYGYLSNVYRCRYCGQWHIGRPIDQNWRRREARA